MQELSLPEIWSPWASCVSLLLETIVGFILRLFEDIDTHWFELEVCFHTNLET